MRDVIRRPSAIPLAIATKMAMNPVIGRALSDKTALEILYKNFTGRAINWEAPKGFVEKLQWLKLYNRSEIQTQLVDKIEAKQFAEKAIGSCHVLPLLGIWSCFDAIDFSSLPDQFVLKTNHDSGGVSICRNKRTFDQQACRVKLNAHLKRNQYIFFREWPYLNVKPKILCEKLLLDGNGGVPADYKLYCFNNGRIITLVVAERFSEKGPTKAYFDENWNPVSVRGDTGIDVSFYPKPPHFEEMKEAARIVSKGMPFLRVDFFDTPECYYLGEFTFYPVGGFPRFSKAIDDLFGSWVNLSID